MNDQELLEWYKNNSSKPADMSQQDYELNVNKALKLKQDQALDQNLASQQAAVKQAQTNAQQSASISNEKLMKYLGQAQLSSGVAKGQTSSDFINANNSYVQNRAAIANNAAAQQNELLNEYTNNKIANEAQAASNEISILDKYKQLAKDEEDRAMAKEDRQREIEQWNLEMEAYKQELKNIQEDREIAAADRLKAQQEAEDIAWLEAANERVNKMYSELMDENGDLDSEDKAKIEAEIATYKDKFKLDSNYERLLDLYKTLVY